VGVSHRERLSPDELAGAFLTGRVRVGFRPHLRVIFDELPSSVLVGAIRQVSAAASKPERVLDHVRSLAQSVGSELRL
jgi:hypothetical protein